MKKEIVLQDSQRLEILKLVDQLQQHKKEYNAFKSFTSVCNDALTVADALLNNDYATFKKYKLYCRKDSLKKRH